MSNQVDALEMSDEDFLNTPVSEFAPIEEPEVVEEEEVLDEQAQEEPTPTGDTNEYEPLEVEQPVEAEADVVDQAEPEAKPQEAKDSAGEVDYKAAYEQVFAPFKANGKEYQINSVEEAVTLMQMGANYNKKMQALKPNLNLLRVLEANNLLSQEKISYLIDLDKKNPEAISKLLSESNIDPLDVDLSKAQDYTPNTYTVDERKVALDEVLDAIQDTPTYRNLLSVVSNKWDVQSKQVIADTPQLLRVINDHMASGVYDLISNEIERERMFGRLEGVSDLEAYRQVGDALNARGAFNQLVNTNGTVAPKVVAKTQTSPTSDQTLRDQRKAASSPRTAVSTPKVEYNPLDMSDEEFLKLDGKFI